MAGFEEEVRLELERLTGYACKKTVRGRALRIYLEGHCVLLDENDLRKGYLEVKETSASANQSTYINICEEPTQRWGNSEKWISQRGLSSPRDGILTESIGMPCLTP